MDAGRHRLGHRLEFGQRLVAELVDVDRSRRVEHSALRGRVGGGFGIVGGIHENGLAETADLGTQHGGRAFVPENDIRAGHFFLNRKLGGEDGIHERVIETTASPEALDLRGTGGCDHQHLILAEVEALFKEQGHIRDKALRPIHSGFFEGIKTFLPYPRMEDRLEPSPRRLVGKDPPAQEMTVYAAGFVERAIAKGLGDERRHLRHRLEQAVNRRIAIEDHQRGQVLAQQPAHGRFPGGNSSRQGHHSHRMKHHAGRGAESSMEK